MKQFPGHEPSGRVKHNAPADDFRALARGRPPSLLACMDEVISTTGRVSLYISLLRVMVLLTFADLLRA